MAEWFDTGDATMRCDYSNYIYGIIKQINMDPAYRGELFDCSGFECKRLASHVFYDLQETQHFVDEEAQKY